MNHTNNNPAKISRNLSIAQDRLSGMVYRQLADKYQLTKTHIGAILKDKEINSIIQTGFQQQVSMIPLADKVYHDRLTDNENPKLQLDAARDIHKNTGIAATRTDNPLVAKYIQINQVNLVDPGLQSAFSQQFSALSDPDESIDAEYTDDNGSFEGDI